MSSISYINKTTACLVAGKEHFGQGSFIPCPKTNFAVRLMEFGYCLFGDVDIGLCFSYGYAVMISLHNINAWIYDLDGRSCFDKMQYAI